MPTRQVSTGQSARIVLPETGHLLGAGITLFAFTPVIAMMSGLANSVVYTAGLGAVALFAFVSLAIGYRVQAIRPTAGHIGLLLLLLLMATRMPSLDTDEQWEALLSVALSAAMVIAAHFASAEKVLKGVVWTVVLLGIVTALYTNYDPNYVQARVAGWGAEDVKLLYTMTAVPVAAAIGPAVLGMRAQKSWPKRIALGLLALFLTYSLSTILARTALLTGLAALFLAAIYGLKRTGFNRLMTALRTGAIALPLLPFVFLAVLDSNSFLMRRFSRMLNPQAEMNESGRGYLWSTAWEMFLERPGWGWGIHGAESALGIYPHQAFLEAMADLGLLGGFAIAAIVFSFLFSLARVVLRETSAYVLAIHLIAFIPVIESMKASSLYLSRPFLILAILAPLLSYEMLRDARKEKAAPRQRRPYGFRYGAVPLRR